MTPQLWLSARFARLMSIMRPARLVIVAILALVLLHGCQTLDICNGDNPPPRCRGA